MRMSQYCHICEIQPVLFSSTNNRTWALQTTKQCSVTTGSLPNTADLTLLQDKLNWTAGRWVHIVYHYPNNAFDRIENHSLTCIQTHRDSNHVVNHCNQATGFHTCSHD